MLGCALRWISGLHITYRIEVGFAAGVDNFYLDSVDIGDEAVHAGAGAEFASS